MRKLLILLSLCLLCNTANATKQVPDFFSHSPVVVCQPLDSNANCTIGSGGLSGYWTLSGSNVYAPITDTVTVGNATTTLDTFTVNSLSGGVAINGVPASGIGGIDSYTKAMLHFNNNITDSSFAGNTYTNNGSVAFTNSDPPFTSKYWAIFNGGGTKSITTPDSSAFTLASSDFTIDFVVKFNSHTTDGNFLSQDTNANNFWGFQFATGGPGNRLQWYVLSGGSIVQRLYALFTPVDGTHYHIEFVRNGSTPYIFVNGVSQSIVTASGFAAVADQTGNLIVGTNVHFANDPDAEIAEMRFSVGIARNTSNFTPPATEYTSTATTPLISWYGNSSLLGNIGISSSTNVMSIINNAVTAQSIDSTGITTFGNDITTSTHNIVTDTTTGTSFGTGTTQKTSAYGATPVVQGGATTDLGTILSNWGLRASGTAYPITTSGTTNLSGTNTINGYATTAKAVSFLSYQPGLLTAVNATIGVYAKVSNASTVDNIIGSAVTFSCVANPTITMYECGTSATCTSSPVTIGTVTVTAAGTAVTGTVSNPAITAGDYIGFAMTAGTCASIDISANAQIHSN